MGKLEDKLGCRLSSACNEVQALYLRIELEVVNKIELFVELA